VVEAPAVRHRAQSLGEEIANSISHGTGFLAALIGLPVLVIDAVRHGAAAIVGAGVFAATMALLYLTSTLYHALAPNRAKRVFQILDHVAIYLLIAGTYTPFTLGVLWGPWGWTLFGLIWALAVAGIVLKSVGGVRHPRISTGLYVVMGWLILAAAKPLWHAMPGWGLFWLLNFFKTAHVTGTESKGQRLLLLKITDFDRPKGIFTDYGMPVISSAKSPKH